jgi:hypothetical protein
MNGEQAVFGIYRYDTGIWPFFDYFWTGMVYWYAKVVWDEFDFFPLGGVNMSSKPLCHWSPSHDSLPTRAIGSLATLCHTAVQKLPVTPYSRYGAADAPAFETDEELGVAWHGAESLHNADLSVRSHRRAVLNAEQQFAHRCANSDPALFFGPCCVSTCPRCLLWHRL